MERRVHLRRRRRPAGSAGAAGVRQFAAPAVSVLRPAARRGARTHLRSAAGRRVGPQLAWPSLHPRHQKVHALFIDVNELTDKTENALKIVGDVYAARVFALAAARLGLDQWK